MYDFLSQQLIKMILERTIEATPSVLMVNVLCESVLFEQLMRGVLEFGKRLRCATIIAHCCGAF